MKVVLNKIALDKFGAKWAYVKLIEYADNDPIIREILNASPRELADAIFERIY